MMTQTVLFFVYSNKYICANRIEGARRYAEKAGWTIQVIERNNVDFPLDVRGIVKFWDPVGIIAECGGGMPEISRETIGDMPLVYLDEDPDGEKGEILCVNSASARIGELAAKELLALNLPHYGFVGWRKPRFWSEKRREAFASAIGLHGRECMVFDCPAHESELGRSWRLREWLAGLPKPCGVFAVHDPVGEEVLRLAAKEGIQVPGELAVIGVDDDAVICERTTPTLTSIGIDFEQGGYRCAELLARRIEDAGFTSAEVEYEATAVTRRQSTLRFPQIDHRVTRALEFIRKSACEGIGTPEVAERMGLSRRMAEIVFRRYMHCTIHDKIIATRMQRVEQLLRNPKQDIAAIAGLCGWLSGSVLRKLFKECHNGLSMREWREQEA